MNTKTLKGMGAAVSLLVGIGTASPALATSTGPQALDFQASSSDAFIFSCPDIPAFRTVRVEAQVLDLPPANVVARMQVAASNGVFPTITGQDNNEGDALPSPNAGADTGPGTYVVVFKKTGIGLVANGIEGYEGRVRCLDEDGNVLHPPLIRRINQ